MWSLIDAGYPIGGNLRKLSPCMELLDFGDQDRNSGVIRREINVYTIQENEHNQMNPTLGLILILSAIIFCGIILCLIL